MTLDISAIRQRIEKATPGPWELWDGNSWRRFGNRMTMRTVCEPVVYSSRDPHPDLHFNNPADADLIAHAPADLLSLLEEVEALTDKIEEQRCFYEDLCTKLVADLTPPASTPSESS